MREIISEDNYLAEYVNKDFYVCVMSVLGDRSDQQDSTGVCINSHDGMIVVCDGMGGHECGKMASNTAVNDAIESYSELRKNVNEDALRKLANQLDIKISGLKHEDGTRMVSGTTLALVCITEDNLYWVSAGDTRIYLIRGNTMVQVTTDHNYRLLLRERLNAGEISQAEYDAEEKNGDILVSYLGAGELPVIDSNSEPFKLRGNDRILICSDGLYRVLDDSKLRRELMREDKSLKQTLIDIEEKAAKKAFEENMKRDNTTAVLIQFKEKNIV